MKPFTIFSIALLLHFGAYAQPKLQKGTWRGVFPLKEGIESPFNFEITDQEVYLLNGEERFEIKNFIVRNDSLILPIELFESTLAARIITKDHLEGEFIRNGQKKPLAQWQERNTVSLKTALTRLSAFRENGVLLSAVIIRSGFLSRRAVI